ncbi:hypothetical protein ACTFIV_008244 [Dictyostelium citrinum]
MKKTFYSFLVVVIISIIVKVSINQSASNNCIEFPNVCNIEQTCVIQNSTEYSCLRIDEVPITYHQVAVNTHENGVKSYQYDVSFINNSKNKLKNVRISTECNLYLKDGIPSFWNVDRFPNGDLIIKEDQIIYPKQIYNFGFILKNEITPTTLKLKALEIIE